MPIKQSYKDLLDVNEYIQKLADSFYFMCTTRTVQESKLFPVNPYITLSYYNAWYRYPELVRKVVLTEPPRKSRAPDQAARLLVEVAQDQAHALALQRTMQLLECVESGRVQ